MPQNSLVWSCYCRIDRKGLYLQNIHVFQKLFVFHFAYDFSTPNVKSIKPLMACAWLLFTSPLASSLTMVPSLRRMWKIVCKPGTGCLVGYLSGCDPPSILLPSDDFSSVA